MDHKDIFERLQPIIKTYLPEDVKPGEISLEADLTRELNINSAHLVDVVLDVEDAFDIELNNQDMEELRTVNDAIRIIGQKLESNN